jgi:hypothetical protein
MKKLIAMFALCLAFGSQAAVIKVELDKAQYQKNDLVQAQIRLQGYTDGLAGFKLDLSYWSAALGFEAVTFGPHFSPVEPNFGDYSKNGSTLTISEMNLFDFAWDLAGVQGPDFTLATVTFKALGGGLHKLLLNNIELTDAWGDQVKDFSVDPVAVNVAGPAVPAPATALLLLPALLLLRRRS